MSVTEAMVIAMLDQLAEFESQKDSIAANKQALLDEVKLPAEVQAIINAGTEELNGLEAQYAPDLQRFTAEIEKELAEIVVPLEIREALAAIDAQRAAVRAKQTAYNQDLTVKLTTKRQEIQARVNAQVQEAYSAQEIRKDEISAEFAGQIDAVDENIERLRAAIKEHAKEIKHTIKGKLYTAVYVSGRVSWNTDGLDRFIEDHPDAGINYLRKQGDPTITLKHV